MRKNINIVTIILLALLLSACSGGKNKVNNDISIEMCSDNKTTTLNKGDKVTALTNDTELKIIHKSDSTKEVCVENGQAKVTPAS